MRAKVHLLVRRKPACGAWPFHAASKNPAAVTCGRCQHTIAMADAEARQTMKGRRK